MDKRTSTLDWVKIKAGLTPEELNWLWNYLVVERKAKSQKAPLREDLRNEIFDIFNSLAQGHFVRTKENVEIVKNMLTRLRIYFNDKDLELCS